MKKIGIICALQSELENFKKAMNEQKVIEHKTGTYYVGKIGDVEVCSAVCSIGKVNATIKAQFMIDNFELDAVINSGIAGSLSNRVNHFDVVVGEKLYYHDFDLKLFSDYFPNQTHFVCDKGMQDEFLQANKSESGIVVGNIATGDEFVMGKDRKVSIASIMDGVCAEMEGTAIAHTAYVNNLPVLVIRCISDMADDNADFDYHEFEIKAADKASRMVINYLNTIKS